MMIHRHKIVLLLTLFLSTVLSGCVTNTGGASNFKLTNLAKTEIDTVTDMHIRQIRHLSRQLTIKLYKRNPRELAKAPPGTTIDKRLQQLFSPSRPTGFSELGGADGVTAVPVAFAEGFEGDRVFALMAGITGMLHAAYNHQDEFFMLDEIDQQKLYNSARNLEATAWQLNNRRNEKGELYILSNGTSAEGIRNLSYERLFGKLIAHQDMMAMIIADSTNRTITKVVHSAASMTLLPI